MKLTSLLTRGGPKRLFQEVCERYQLVYFGHVDQHSDEHELVRGVTLSPQHRDEHFCVGTILGRDVIFLQRDDTLSFPGKDSVQYAWVLLQVDLRRDGLPHVFVDARHHGEVFYDNLLSKFTRFHRLDPAVVARANAKFAETFSVYTPPDMVTASLQVLSSEALEALATQFNQFDFEWFQDRLIIYAQADSAGQRTTMATFEQMIRVGVWLADHLDAART